MFFVIEYNGKTYVPDCEGDAVNSAEELPAEYKILSGPYASLSEVNYEIENKNKQTGFHYVIQTFNPAEIRITPKMDKGEIYRKYGNNIRFLAGSFSTAKEAREAVPTAKERMRLWNRTCPMFFMECPQIKWVSSLSEFNAKAEEKEERMESKYGSMDLAALSF